MRRDLRDTSSAPILNFHRGAFPGQRGEAGGWARLPRPLPPPCPCLPSAAEGRGGDAGGTKMPLGSSPALGPVSLRFLAGLRRAEAGPCLRARRFVLGRRGSASGPTSVSRGSPTGSRLAEGGLSESAHPRPTPCEASAVPSGGTDGAATPDGAVCRLVVAPLFLSAPLEPSSEARGNGERWS